MSNPLSPPPSLLDGCLSVVMGLAGVVMLLPGLCSIIMAVSIPLGVNDMGPALLILSITFAIGFGGIMLIRAALRGRGS